MLLQVHGGGWSVGDKEHQGVPLMRHLAAKGWVCVAINYRLSPRAPMPGPRRRRQAGDRLDQGPHRVLRRRPRLRRHHRRLGRRPPGRPGRGDPRRPRVPAGLRGRRHLGAGRGAPLRRLRLRRRHGPAQRRADARHVPGAARSCSAASPTTRRSSRASRRCCGSRPTTPTSSCCTARATPWSTCARRGCSSQRLRETSSAHRRLRRAARRPARLRPPALDPLRRTWCGPSTATCTGTGTAGADEQGRLPTRRPASGTGVLGSADAPTDLLAHARAATGFMPDDEGDAAAPHARCARAPHGPLLEVGTYCGKSAVYLGAAARETGGPTASSSPSTTTAARRRTRPAGSTTTPRWSTPRPG